MTSAAASLDGQRKPVQSKTDFGDCGGVASGYGEVRFHRLGPRDEEAHRLVLTHPRHGRQVGPVRQRQWRQRVLMLTVGMEWRSTRRQHLETWDLGEQIRDHRRRLDHPLDVVQKEQEPL